MGERKQRVQSERHRERKRDRKGAIERGTLVLLF